jgi:hypothetical protein
LFRSFDAFVRCLLAFFPAPSLEGVASAFRLLTGWCRRKFKTAPAGLARSAVSKIAAIEVGGKFEDEKFDAESGDEEVAPADERIRSTDDVKSDAPNSRNSSPTAN